jgi:hypothetical protein
MSKAIVNLLIVQFFFVYCWFFLSFFSRFKKGKLEEVLCFIKKRKEKKNEEKKKREGEE